MPQFPSSQVPPALASVTTPQKSHFYSIYENIWRENLSRSKRDLVAPSFETLALLFIIIDDLPHELIWRIWLHQTKSREKKTIRIFIHAKYPDRIRSRWVRSHLVRFHYSPEWGSIEITKVMIELLREVSHALGASPRPSFSSLTKTSQFFILGNSGIQFHYSFLLSF
jgi:hypothetical protein